jgi:hypothetical protein
VLEECANVQEYGCSFAQFLEAYCPRRVDRPLVVVDLLHLVLEYLQKLGPTLSVHFKIVNEATSRLGDMCQFELQQVRSDRVPDQKKKSI